MKNQFDTRIRSAHEVVADLRKMRGEWREAAIRSPRSTSTPIAASRHFVAILGSHHLPGELVADALVSVRDEVEGQLGFEVMRVLTGCADVGAEKAARLAATRLTGELAVVFHRAELTYGKLKAEEIRDTLLAQEADALLLLTAGSKVCRHARERFSSRGKKIIEVEITCLSSFPTRSRMSDRS